MENRISHLIKKGRLLHWLLNEMHRCGYGRWHLHPMGFCLAFLFYIFAYDKYQVIVYYKDMSCFTLFLFFFS
ncbi:hypothetical protein EUGRSUZ_H01898 [Eucalyptus grandis]|uniref:Uncharacterized protein n=2 Tax=Eucalyptus grandis TaxID=71139 RepID=A0ACC3JV22_EUCGR|nr:hypothetical protein EUGRSUZ_H01898 [Eucalyptus grandis]